MTSKSSSGNLLKFVVPALLLGCCVGLYVWERGSPFENEFQPFSNNGSDLSFISLHSGSGEDITWNRTLDELVTTVDGMLDGKDTDKEKAFNIMRRAYGRFGKEPEFLWRYAKSAFMLSQIEASKGFPEAEKELVFRANNFAATALSINPNKSDIHKWYAITLGKRGDWESASERITNGYKFKDHIERAIELNPTDPSPYYLLGRWCFGVYQLSWVERKVAATLFGEPPSSTIDDALKNFMEAETRKPGSWKENMLFIAKCLVEKRDYETAVSWLDKAVGLPVISQDDKESQGEIDKLLYSYSGYRH